MVHLPLRPGEWFPARRAASGKPVPFSRPRARSRHDSGHFRYDVAPPLHDDPVADSDIEFVDVVGVVERGSCDRRPAQEHRFEARILDSIKGKLGKIKAPDLLLKRISKILDDERKNTG